MAKAKCEKCRSKRATSIIRQKQVCSSCFDLLSKDNKQLNNEIPKGLGLKFK